jgi:hypothetical protein
MFTGIPIRMFAVFAVEYVTCEPFALIDVIEYEAPKVGVIREAVTVADGLIAEIVVPA